MPRKLEMNNGERGFTLMEVLIVIVIIGILAAIAIPSYQRYINKTRAMAAVVLTGSARLAITEHAILHNGDLASVSNTTLNLPNAQLIGNSKNVSNITITGISANSAQITATLTDKLGTLIWTGIYHSASGEVSWTCTYPTNDVIAQYAPKTCQAT